MKPWLDGQHIADPIHYPCSSPSACSRTSSSVTRSSATCSSSSAAGSHGARAARLLLTWLIGVTAAILMRAPFVGHFAADFYGIVLAFTLLFVLVGRVPQLD